MYATAVFDVQNVLVLGLVLCIILIVASIIKHNAKAFIIPSLILVAFVSASLYHEYANNIQLKNLYPFCNRTVSVTAEVITTPVISESSISFHANINTIADDKTPVKLDEKVRVVHYLDENAPLESITMPSLGDIIELCGEVKIPSGPMNTGSFDYARYLKTEKIFFNFEANLLKCSIINHCDRFMHKIENFRIKCSTFISNTFPDDVAGVLNAFVIGDKSFLDEDVSVAFTKSGLSHILAVSGLHVSVFISAVVFFLKRMRLSKRKQLLISVVCTIVFVIFTGASPSSVRAGMMATFALIAKLVYRKADSLTTLSVAAAVLSLFNPLIIYDAGYMLSFSSTAGIILFYQTISSATSKVYTRLNNRNIFRSLLSWLSDGFAVGLSAQIFTVPLLIYLFNSFSLVSIVATMVVSPFLPFILIGGLLFIGISFISVKFAATASCLLLYPTRAMLLVAEFFSQFGFSQVLYGQLTLFVILTYLLTVLTIIFLIRKKKTAYIVTVISLCMLSILGLFNYFAHFKLASVSFLNVGQGDCALFKAPGNCDVLIDAGGYSQNKSTGEYIISPYLLKNGVTDVEYLFLSHIDLDHTVGISGLVKTHKIKKIIIPYGQQYGENFAGLADIASEHGTDILFFTRGDVLKVNDEITITALSPDSEQFKYSDKENDTGLVLRLDYGESSFLFCGDISETIENHLLNNSFGIKETDVLKVAHHGSKYSTCQKFTDAIKPKFAFISAGKNNYGHPNFDIVDRLQKTGTQVFISAINKDVTFYFDKKEIKGVKCTKPLIEEGIY